MRTGASPEGGVWRLWTPERICSLHICDRPWQVFGGHTVEVGGLGVILALAPDRDLGQYEGRRRHHLGNRQHRVEDILPTIHAQGGSLLEHEHVRCRPQDLLAQVLLHPRHHRDHNDHRSDPHP